MLLEKIPYHLIDVDIPAGLANDPCRQILIATGPGVPTPFNRIKNDLPSPFPLSGLAFCCAFWVGPSQLIDFQSDTSQ